MSLERDVQQKVNVLKDAVKDTVYNNLVKVVLSEEIDLKKEALPGLQLLVDQSIEQAFTNNREGISEVLKNR
jgi:hypothetical protein